MRVKYRPASFFSCRLKTLLTVDGVATSGETDYQNPTVFEMI